MRRRTRPTGNRRRAPERARVPSPAALGRGLVAGGRRAAVVVRSNLTTVVAVVAVVIVVGLGVIGYRWVTTSPRFALAKVEVHGAARIGDAVVRARLADAMGDNLFRLSLGELEAELEAVPWIADAELRRELPDKLVVEIREHVPAAVIELGGLYLADADGHVFVRVKSERDDLTGLPVITGLTREQLGRDRAGVAGEIRAALAVAAAWRGDGRPALGEIHLEPDRGVTVYTLEPAVAVYLGDGEPGALGRRLATFDAAWAALDASERARATSVHLGRDPSPARVTIAFAERR